MTGKPKRKKASPGRKDFAEPSFKEAVRETILDHLRDGMSMVAVCKLEGMPNASSVYAWIAEDPEFDQQVTRAREVGYLHRADKAVKDAKDADDAALGRLAFDAERWYLGKLSIAFRDKVTIAGDPAAPLKHEHDMTHATPEQLAALETIGIKPG